MTRVPFNSRLIVRFSDTCSDECVENLHNQFTELIKSVCELVGASIHFQILHGEYHYIVGRKLLPVNVYHMSKIFEGFAGLFQSLPEVDRCVFQSQY